jgi:hypothetical protein
MIRPTTPVYRVNLFGTNVSALVAGLFRGSRGVGGFRPPQPCCLPLRVDGQERRSDAIKGDGPLAGLALGALLKLGPSLWPCEEAWDKTARFLDYLHGSHEEQMRLLKPAERARRMQ